MPVTPTSAVGQAIHGVRRLVAHSPAFQERVGTPGNVEAAFARVHVGDVMLPKRLEGQSDLQFPLAIVMAPPGPRWRNIQTVPLAGGLLWLYLADVSRQKGNYEADTIDALNLETVVDEMALMVGEHIGDDDWPILRSIEASGSIQHPQLQDMPLGDLTQWFGWWTIHWGLE